jgi:hypothetical protein
MTNSIGKFRKFGKNNHQNVASYMRERERERERERAVLFICGLPGLWICQ